MSLIVDVEANFEISFFYELLYHNNKIIGVYILNEFDNLNDIEEVYNLVNEKKLNIDKKCIGHFKGIFRLSNYEEMSEIRELSSVINHRNEKAMLWMKLFRPKIISTLCIEWNIKDLKGNLMEISEKSVNKMHEHVIIEIVNRWAAMIGARRIKNGTDI